MLSVDQIRPIRNHVLVRPDPVATVTAGGIHIPETVNKDNPNYFTMTGVVIAAGNGAHDGESFKPMSLKAGDRVVFGRYAGKQIEADRHTFLMMKETEILGLADGEYVQPGYQAPKHSAIKNRPGAQPL